MADDHYALDIGRAREAARLGAAAPAGATSCRRWSATLKRDPQAWYERNKHHAAAPGSRSAARPATRSRSAAQPRTRRRYRGEHRDNRWAHFVNMRLGAWLLTQPPLIEVHEPWLALVARSASAPR